MAEKELSEFNDKLHFILCNIKSGEPKINEPEEIEEIRWMTFENFFETYDDTQIGHGLIHLRENSQLWRNL